MRRLLIRVTVASVVINAAIGVAVLALTSGDLSEGEGKLLGTSLLVSAMSISAIPCVLCWETGSLRVLAQAAILGLVVGFTLVIYGIWAEPEAEDFWRVSGTILTLGLAGSLACLLSSAGARGRFAWLLSSAYFLTGLMALEVVVAIWGSEVDDTFARVLGITAVMLSANVVLVPVLARGSVAVFPGTGLTFCPRCGSGLEEHAAGEVLRCGSCAGEFRIEIVSAPW